ncbi:MAG: hypothetical protein Q8P26_00070 [Candidatus Levybacteria bacterium]|nr:hypothetical protein [Candidatus Levybacteria bacterium]
MERGIIEIKSFRRNEIDGKSTLRREVRELVNNGLDPKLAGTLAQAVIEKLMEKEWDKPILSDGRRPKIFDPKPLF